MESSASAGCVASAVLDPRRWRVLALLCGAFFMVLLDGTITIVALPSSRPLPSPARPTAEAHRFFTTHAACGGDS